VILLSETSLTWKEEEHDVRRLFVFLFTFDGRLLSLVL
jgi:hypothetical protein